MACFVRRVGGVLRRARQDPFKQCRRLRWRCGLTVFQLLLEGAGAYLHPAEEISRHLLYFISKAPRGEPCRMSSHGNDLH